MIRRLAIALLVCGGLGFFLQREMERGSFDAWHRIILMELRQWQGAPPPAPVTLVELRRGDLPFESWPPAPMDYALIFESLVRREPRTVAVQSLLDWPAVEALDAATLAERIALLPRGVLACTLSNSPLASENPAIPLAPLKYVAGDLTALPSFTGAGQAPIDDVRSGKAAGFTRIEFGENPQAHETHVSIPLLAQKDGQVFPSLLLQTMLGWEGRGVDDALVTLGRDIIISPALRLPIDHAGRFSLPTRLADPIRRLDAGSLLLDLEKDASLLQTQPEALETLRNLPGALLVLGETGEGTPRVSVGPGIEWTEAELLAQTLRAALSGHFWREPEQRAQWLVWALAGAGGLLLLASPRRWLAVFALGGAASLALGLILAFWYGRWWLPPLPPLALWAAASVVAALLPAAKAPEKTPPTQPATPPSPAPEPPITEPAEISAADSAAAAEADEAPSWERTSDIPPLPPAASDAPSSLSAAESSPLPPTPQLEAKPASEPDDFPKTAPSAPDAREAEEEKETEEDHALVHQLLEEIDAPDEAAPPSSPPTATAPKSSAETPPPSTLETESPAPEPVAPDSATPTPPKSIAETATESLNEPASESATPAEKSPSPPAPDSLPASAPPSEPASEEPAAPPGPEKPGGNPPATTARPPATKKLHKKKKHPPRHEKNFPPPDKPND